MIIKYYEAGIYYANCYLIMDENSKEIVIIDPGGNGDMLEKGILELGGTPKYIILTHGHVDHVGGVEYLCNKFNIPFYISKVDEEYMLKDDYVFGTLKKADGYLKEGDILNIGSEEIKVIETPGHTKGGLSFKLNDMIFTGDTLFRASIGRTDFLGGDLREIISSIKDKLLVYSDDTIVYPGHGEKSTVGFERNNNPYLI